MGFKEDIVVSEYTGQTEYDFMLYTNGLKLEEIDGSLFLMDDEEEIAGTVGDILILCADGKTSLDGKISYEEIVANEVYRIGIHINEPFLSDESTAYPIRIDPTIEVNYDNNGASGIKDVTVYSNSNSSHSSTALYVGKRNTYGISRVLMKFPGMDLSPIHSCLNVQSAKVEIRDIGLETTGMLVYCYCFEDTWGESTASWSSVDCDKYGPVLSNKLISYSNGQNQTTAHRYQFDIKGAVQKWVESDNHNGSYIPKTFNKDKGIIFKAKQSVEDGNTENYKTFASYNRTSYRPSAKVTYTVGIQTNPFYSRYDPDKFNVTANEIENPIYEVRYIRCRMNCYGYALRHIYDDSRDGTISPGSPHGFTNDCWYKQIPGDFVSASELSNVNSHESLSNSTNITELMEMVCENWEKDANNLTYSLTYYTPSSDGWVEQCTNNYRMIAVVTGNYNTNTNQYDASPDFHFYMQHSDGTWSHKQGSQNISNLSIDTNRILTNSNIISKAKEGKYKNGCIRFYKVTRSTIIDRPHSNYYEGELTQFFDKDVAGEYGEDNRSITGNIDGTLDFSEDVDCFQYTPGSNRTYTIKPVCGTETIIGFQVRSSNGTYLGGCSSTSPTGLSITLYAGSQYYFYVSSSTVEYANYQLQII